MLRKQERECRDAFQKVVNFVHAELLAFAAVALLVSDHPRRMAEFRTSAGIGAMVVWAVQKPWLKQNLPYRAAHFPTFPGNPWQQRRPPPSVPENFQAWPTGAATSNEAHELPGRAALCPCRWTLTNGIQGPASTTTSGGATGAGAALQLSEPWRG